MEIAAAIIGCIVTGLLGLVYGKHQSRAEKKAMQSRSASLLYLDLKSIEEYVRERHNGTILAGDYRLKADIRYNNDWQQLVINCASLPNSQHKTLRKIYDHVYDYNCAFKQCTSTKPEHLVEVMITKNEKYLNLIRTLNGKEKDS